MLQLNLKAERLSPLQFARRLLSQTHLWMHWNQRNHLICIRFILTALYNLWNWDKRLTSALPELNIWPLQNHDCQCTHPTVCIHLRLLSFSHRCSHYGMITFMVHVTPSTLFFVVPNFNSIFSKITSSQRLLWNVTEIDNTLTEAPTAVSLCRWECFNVRRSDESRLLAFQTCISNSKHFSKIARQGSVPSTLATLGKTCFKYNTKFKSPTVRRRMFVSIIQLGWSSHQQSPESAQRPQVIEAWWYM